MPEEINTIQTKTESKFKEKGSLFIGQAYPVNTPDEAEVILARVRKEYYDATHYCFAYQVMENDPRYSDDGEPGGTAGIRIVNAINHFGLTNVLVVSIRYYGGTKLGVGPLGKAYYKSAFEALEGAKIITKKNFVRVRITFDYDLISKIHHHLSQYTVKIEENLFEEKPVIIFQILEKELKFFEEEIIQATRNTAGLEIVEREIFR